MSLEYLSPFFAASACAVAVWNAIMFTLAAVAIATLAADCASIIVWMMATTDVSLSGGLAALPVRPGVPPAASRGPPLGGSLPLWPMSPVATVGVPLPALRGG